MNTRIREALRTMSVADQQALDRAHDRARRHARQAPARRQRHRRGLARLRPRRCRCCARCRCGKSSPANSACRSARAADPDLRRRRARRGARRHPGLHDHLHRRRQLRRGARMDRAGLCRRRQAPRETRRAAGRRRRRRLLARLQDERGRRWRSWSARSPMPASSPAPTSRSRSTSPPTSFSAPAATSSRSRSARSAPSSCTRCCCAGSSATRSCRSRTPSPSTDADALRAFTKAASGVQVVGDDFFVTSAERVRKAAGACNAVLLKPNQVGTVTETLACWDAARESGYRAIVSARSGETEDVSIVHLAVGWGVPPAQGRQLLALRAHGEVERRRCASRRRSAPRRCPTPPASSFRVDNGRTDIGRHVFKDNLEGDVVPMCTDPSLGLLDGTSLTG